MTDGLTEEEKEEALELVREMRNKIEEDSEPARIDVGFHPLGGVALTITDAKGDKTTIQLDQNQVAQLQMTLVTINVILTQNQFAEQQAERERVSAILRGVNLGH